MARHHWLFWLLLFTIDVCICITHNTIVRINHFIHLFCAEFRIHILCRSEGGMASKSASALCLACSVGLN